MACLIVPLDSTNLEKYLAHSRHPKHTSCLNRGVGQQEKMGKEASTFNVQPGSGSHRPRTSRGRQWMWRDVQSEPRSPDHLVRAKVNFSLLVTIESVKDWLWARKWGSWICLRKRVLSYEAWMGKGREDRESHPFEEEVVKKQHEVT